MASRRSRSVVAVAVALLLLGGCGAPASTASAVGKPVSTGSPARLTHPAVMVGLWRVAAAGEPPGTVLRIGDDLSVWRKCDDFFGGWMADSHGRFVAGVFTYTPNCAGGAGPAAPPVTWPPVITWLAEARTYRVTGTGRLLLDAAGHVVARLLPGGKPIPNRHIAPQVWAPPRLDSRLVQTLREPVPLPRSLTAATTAEVVGRWVPMPAQASLAGHPKRPARYIVFRGDGSWTSSDGCNIMDGRWSLGAGGSLLSVNGPSTLVGCAQSAISTMFETRRLGFAGKILVFVSASGTELGRLIRG